MSPYDALVRYFGFSAFRPGQEEPLHHLLAGRDALVVMRTGSGKSLIYQLAALMLPGTALVFSPLVALMKDQADSLTRRHIPAAFINSTLDAGEQSRRLHALANSEYKIVLIAPERLRNGAFRTALARVKQSLIVVDKAHCLSQWGHDFRPDYLHIAEAALCCDNDLVRATAAQAQGRHAETDAGCTALVALQAVASLKWGLGKDKLVMLLKGSHSRKVETYATSPYFGKLVAWRVAVRIDAEYPAARSEVDGTRPDSKRAQPGGD